MLVFEVLLLADCEVFEFEELFPVILPIFTTVGPELFTVVEEYADAFPPLFATIVVDNWFFSSLSFSSIFTGST